MATENPNQWVLDTSCGGRVEFARLFSTWAPRNSLADQDPARFEFDHRIPAGAPGRARHPTRTRNLCRTKLEVQEHHYQECAARDRPGSTVTGTPSRPDEPVQPIDEGPDGGRVRQLPQAEADRLACLIIRGGTLKSIGPGHGQPRCQGHELMRRP
jgi:hypothetical protein